MNAPTTNSHTADDVVARTGTSQALRFLIAGVVAMALLAALRWSLVPDSRTRNLEFAPDMFRSPAVESQTLAPAIPGGLSQQRLVPGVVPRDLDHVPFSAGAEEAARAGTEWKSPFTDATDERLATARERGRDLYGVHCTVCHGADGEGKGAAVMRGMLPPPTLHGASATGTPDGTLAHVIHFGRGNMTGLGERMTTEDVWSIVLHVRALQEAAR